MTALAIPFVVLGHEDPRLVRLGFAHIPHEWSQALAIVQVNTHHAWLPVLIMAALVQAQWQEDAASVRRAFTCFCDVVIVVLLGHVLVYPVGASVGAYGTRMLLAMLPAGPIELAAYALAASVYLHSRRTPILYLEAGRTRIHRSDAAQALRVASLSGALLVIAALLETFA
jgi:hypothetical protein